jgi:probable F420-dependent oxidoreductase
MRAYLDAMETSPFSGPEPAEPAPLVLAALGPRMLELAAERAAGAHTYFVPVEHTSRARETLGADPVLAVEQTVVLDPDPATARRAARMFASGYLELPNYANNLRRLGWSEDDAAGEGSDALIDATIAWGDLDAIVARVRAHHEAGADHVCVQVVSLDEDDVCLPQLGELAAALVAG